MIFIDQGEEGGGGFHDVFFFFFCRSGLLARGVFWQEKGFGRGGFGRRGVLAVGGFWSEGVF